MGKIKMMLIAIAMLLPSLASADVPAWEWGPKYMGEMHLGYGTSRKQNGYKAYCGRVMLGTLQGVQISNYLSAAVGVDAVMFTHYYKGQDMRFNMDVYLDLRGYYPLSDGFAPFLDLGLGTFFNVHPWNDGKTAFFCQFGPGFRYRKFNFSCGLQQHDTGPTGLTTFYTKVGLYF